MNATHVTFIGFFLSCSFAYCVTIDTFGTMVQQYAKELKKNVPQKNVTRKKIIDAYDHFLKNVDRKLADQLLRVFLKQTIQELQTEDAILKTTPIKKQAAQKARIREAQNSEKLKKTQAEKKAKKTAAHQKASDETIAKLEAVQKARKKVVKKGAAVKLTEDTTAKRKSLENTKKDEYDQ